MTNQQQSELNARRARRLEENAWRDDDKIINDSANNDVDEIIAQEAKKRSN
jgi:hypothetical protein